ncbi:hypothetical protein QM298_10740 [Pseudomonas mendocina]|nr:hypothetical protein [Pseudomonas mendocina]MDV5861384.1 hypothetical protein [Pseudomonas mendocina]
MKGAKEVVWLNPGHMPVFYGLCPSKKAWKREMKRLGASEDYPESQGNTTRMRNKKGQMCVIVSVHESLTLDEVHPLEVIGLIVHEAAHVWQFIRDEIGEYAPSVEFEAYTLQAISQELIGAFCDTRVDLFVRAE